jgi:hypothetical protein
MLVDRYKSIHHTHFAWVTGASHFEEVGAYISDFEYDNIISNGFSQYFLSSHNVVTVLARHPTCRVCRPEPQRSHNFGLRFKLPAPP